MANVLWLTMTTLTLCLSYSGGVNNPWIGESPYPESPYKRANRFLGDLELENFVHEDNSKCALRSCTFNDDCCGDDVCVDVPGREGGLCMPKSEGVGKDEGCQSNDDCLPYMECVDTPVDSPHKTCQPHVREIRKKQYFDECQSTKECDERRGLCCQIVKRHRQRPRKMCNYYWDKNVCIGYRDSNFIYNF